MRSPIPETPGGPQTSNFIDRFWREVHLMKWLEVHISTLPIPAVHHVIDAHEPELPRPIVIMNKLPGAVVMNGFGRLPYPAKVSTLQR